ADSSAAAFFLDAFGLSVGCGVVGGGVFFPVVFAVELFLLVVAVPWVVAVVEVAVVASSFFAHEPRNAAIVRMVIKAKRDVFIGLVRSRMSRAALQSKH